MDEPSGASESAAHMLTQAEAIAAESEVLYRTARASQLRRRPAFRSSGVALRDSNNSYNDLGVPDEVLAKSTLSSESSGKCYQLRCGNGQRVQAMPSKPHKPYPIPFLPASLKRKYSKSSMTESAPDPFDSEGPPSNGCGSILDASSFPLMSLGAWSCVSPAHVGILDDSFASSLSADENLRPLGSLSCGCVRRLCGCTKW